VKLDSVQQKHAVLRLGEATKEGHDAKYGRIERDCQHGTLKTNKKPIVMVLTWEPKCPSPICFKFECVKGDGKEWVLRQKLAAEVDNYYI